MLKTDKIITTTFFIFFPIILLCGFYIQLHGDISPGGGFQSGVIFASAFIGHSLIFRTTQPLLPIYILKIIATSGIFIYILTGIYPIFKNSYEFLSYNAFMQSHSLHNDIINIHINHELGVFFVETGVCITVYASMLLIYFSIASSISIEKQKKTYSMH